MSIFDAVGLITIITIAMADMLSETVLTCKCGQQFKSTFIGACFIFDYHYIKEHVIRGRK